MYYKLIGGELHVCPQNGVFEGKYISNLNEYFDNKPAAALKAGYKKLFSGNVPEFDSEAEYLACNYTELSDRIEQHFTVKKRI